MKKLSLGLLLSSVILSSLAYAAPIPIQNAGFELPPQGSGAGAYTYYSGLNNGWTYTGRGAGIAANGSAFNVSGATGNQAAFLQSPDAAISQDFIFSGSGFSVSFLSEGRSTGLGANPLSVYVDSMLLKFSGATVITPGTTAFSLYTSDLIALTAGTHNLRFIGTNNTSQDVTSFIDEVKLTSVPEPTSIALFGLGLLGLALGRKSIKK